MEQLSVDDRDDARWISVRGEMSKEEVVDVMAEFDKAIDGAASDVVLDMSGVTFISSLGIGLILTARDRLTKGGYRMKLHGVPAFIEEVFQRMSVHECFDWL